MLQRFSMFLLVAALFLCGGVGGFAETAAPKADDLLKEVRLTHNPVIDSEPVYSPDMKNIAFISVSNEEGRFSLHLMDADGGNRHVLADIAGESHSNPAFLSDSETIVYVAGKAGKKQFATIKRDGTCAKTLAAIDGNCASPAAAPQGSTFAFILTREHQTLCLYDLESDTMKQLVAPKNKDCDTPVFSADGKYIFYTEFDMDGTDICRVNADGTNRLVLTSRSDEGTDNINPATTSNGRLFFISNVEDGDYKVVSTNLDGKDAKTHVTEEVFNFTVSPDGSRIVYLTAVKVTLQEYFLFDVAKATTRQITDNTFMEKLARFSPDGKFILYVSDLEGNPEIFKMRIAK